MGTFQIRNTLAASVAAAAISTTGCGGGDNNGQVKLPVDPPVGERPERCLEDPLNSGYCLVWADEFSGDAIDPEKWNHEKNCTGGGNNEAQCYVDDEKNSWVANDLLTIKAIREDASGPNRVDDDPNYDPDDTSGNGSYTSARLRSKGLGDWKYGRFEMRAKLPQGQGSWPAFWMLPSEWAYGSWPLSGEIDILEAVNLKVGGEDQIHGTLHYGDIWPGNVYTGEAYRIPGDLNPADDFHTYAVEWEEGEIRWYVDGDHYATQTRDGWFTTAALENPNAPFDQSFHLILNLAVGGDWPANVNDTGIDESAFPQEYQIDYVRVYQCTEDFDTGRGCASSDGEFVHNPGAEPPKTPDQAGDELVIFDGEIHPPYQWYTYTTDGEVDMEIVASSPEGVYGAGDCFCGDVAEISWNTNEGIGFFQSTSSYDLSDYTYIEFDLRVLQEPVYADSPTLTFRADCVYPCSSGDYPLDMPPKNNWRHIQIPILELEQAGLNSKRINTPFVLSPEWGRQLGAVVQVDNVKLIR
ncbi:family 16 glycosylhydrolase [Microbulbifer bruguierae]|uniref:Family 16 glycosylhydrolase n=1 Tax=Microbulbifer bruguierae TaxID=3029061 RepID=A0ABY8NJ20_9GAMM|nr:glycoside hydrolase family 16 protein [Microbulbifer bruguierae]WGL18440.1 family 16 glycosylhydrolase [Microbulbifer bruguierae]